MKREHLMFVLLSAISIPLLSLSVQEASAHGNFEVVFGGNNNQTLRVVIGETGEPAYVDGIHNMEMRVTDKLTGLANPAAVKFNNGTSSLKLDTWFYPKSTLIGGTLDGAPYLIDADDGGAGVCNTSTTLNVQNAIAGGIGGCGPAPGFTDSEATGTRFVSSVFGKVGEFTGSSQYYTQYGRTLYHFYGQMNYFENSPQAMADIDVWYDGKTIKVAYINGVPATINGGFGLADVTQIYWPGPGGSSVGTSGVTNATHPDNIRSAIGTDRQNGIEEFNFLRSIASAINSINEVIAAGLIPIPPAK